ncbi:hypothetical protein KBD61_04350 [Patescibacteria group bacterium]|nr:hypothetical protein [Patescibacteria group bacterium]
MKGFGGLACLLFVVLGACTETVTATSADATVDAQPTADTRSVDDTVQPMEEPPEDVVALEDGFEKDAAVNAAKDAVEEDAALDASVDQPEADVPIAEDAFAEDVPAEIAIDASEPMDVADAADAIEEDATLDAMGVDRLDVRDADAPDAPLPTVLTVIFEGPPARSYPAGSTRVLLLQFRFIVGPYNLRLWWLPFTWEGVTENDFLQGTWGTNYIFNRHLVDMVMGRDITPPYSSRSPGNARVYRDPNSLINSYDAMMLLAHHQYVVGAVVDIGTVEDAPGELFSGTHSYRATVGGYYPIDRDYFFAHSTIEDADRFGVRYGPERIAGNVPMIGNPMTVLAR